MPLDGMLVQVCLQVCLQVCFLLPFSSLFLPQGKQRLEKTYKVMYFNNHLHCMTEKKEVFQRHTCIKALLTNMSCF